MIQKHMLPAEMRRDFRGWFKGLTERGIRQNGDVGDEVAYQSVEWVLYFDDIRKPISCNSTANLTLPLENARMCPQGS